MFSCSKKIIKKIADTHCLTDKELALVEISLRLNDCYQGLLNECLGIDDGERFFDLQYPNLPKSKLEKLQKDNKNKSDMRM